MSVLIVAVIADKSVAKNEDEVAFCRLVLPATVTLPVTPRLEVVAFVAVNCVAVVVARLVLAETERLVEVALVITPLVLYRVTAVSAVEEAFPSVVAPVTVSVVAVVVVKVEVPDTRSVPCEVSVEVAVILPAVSRFTVAVTAEKNEEKNEVVVALVAVN